MDSMTVFPIIKKSIAIFSFHPVFPLLDFSPLFSYSLSIVGFALSMIFMFLWQYMLLCFGHPLLFWEGERVKVSHTIRSTNHLTNHYSSHAYFLPLSFLMFEFKETCLLGNHTQQQQTTLLGIQPTNHPHSIKTQHKNNLMYRA